MNNYLPLSLKADTNESVDFLANKTKGNYINLKGVNSIEVIDSFHAFLYKYGIWEPTDKVIHTKKPINYVPNKALYHDISFVITFYNMACKSKEYKEKQVQNEIIKTTNDSNISSNLEGKNVQAQITVQSLANPNINHDNNSSNDTSISSISNVSTNINNVNSDIKKENDIVTKDSNNQEVNQEINQEVKCSTQESKTTAKAVSSGNSDSEQKSINEHDTDEFTKIEKKQDRQADKNQSNEDAKGKTDINEKLDEEKIEQKERIIKEVQNDKYKKVGSLEMKRTNGKQKVVEESILNDVELVEYPSSSSKSNKKSTKKNSNEKMKKSKKTDGMKSRNSKEKKRNVRSIKNVKKNVGRDLESDEESVVESDEISVESDKITTESQEEESLEKSEKDEKYESFDNSEDIEEVNDISEDNVSEEVVLTPKKKRGRVSTTVQKRQAKVQSVKSYDKNKKVKNDKKKTFGKEDIKVIYDRRRKR